MAGILSRLFGYDWEGSSNEARPAPPAYPHPSADDDLEFFDADAQDVAAENEPVAEAEYEDSTDVSEAAAAGLFDEPAPAPAEVDETENLDALIEVMSSPAETAAKQAAAEEAAAAEEPASTMSVAKTPVNKKSKVDALPCSDYGIFIRFLDGNSDDNVTSLAVYCTQLQKSETDPEEYIRRNLLEGEEKKAELIVARLDANNQICTDLPLAPALADALVADYFDQLDQIKQAAQASKAQSAPQATASPTGSNSPEIAGLLDLLKPEERSIFLERVADAYARRMAESNPKS